MARRFTSIFLAKTLLVGSAAGLAACASADIDSGSAQGEAAVGEVGLNLNVGGVTLNSVNYVISGPSGFSKTGTLELGKSTTLSATIGGLPAGTGYSITVTSTATDGSTTCTGSTTFSVSARTTTAINLHLICKELPRTGTLVVNGSVNVCPTIDGVSAMPSEVVIGNPLALSASAHDSDRGPSPLAYHWSASSGSFTDASAANPSFTCTVPGSVTLSLSVSDGDADPNCASSSSVTVNCSIPGARSRAPSTLAVYGDAPYGTTPTDTAQLMATAAFINAINADPNVSLVLHVGDIHSGKQYCTEAYDRTVFDLWKAFQDPLVYTPGDNEWADCNKIGEGGGLYNAKTLQIDYVRDAGGTAVDYANGDPLANLALIRSIFFAQPGMTLGNQKQQVLSQAEFNDPTHPADASFVENVMFEQSNVLFVTINVPGGSNNDNDVWYAAPTTTPAQTQEVADRTGADLRWLDAAFAQAQADGVVAVVIQAQADVWDNEKGPAHQAAYEPFVQNIAAHTTAFSKPVLMLNGDSHIYRSDNPLSAADPLNFMHPGYDVPNFHRIVVHGSTLPVEWLRLNIDPQVNAPTTDATFGPFSWERVLPTP